VLSIFFALSLSIRTFAISFGKFATSSASNGPYVSNSFPINFGTACRNLIETRVSSFVSSVFSSDSLGSETLCFFVASVFSSSFCVIIF